jgi:hypothetical protein
LNSRYLEVEYLLDTSHFADKDTRSELDYDEVSDDEISDDERTEDERTDETTEPETSPEPTK